MISRRWFHADIYSFEDARTRLLEYRKKEKSRMKKDKTSHSNNFPESRGGEFLVHWLTEDHPDDTESVSKRESVQINGIVKRTAKRKYGITLYLSDFDQFNSIGGGSSDQVSSDRSQDKLTPLDIMKIRFFRELSENRPEDEKRSDLSKKLKPWTIGQKMYQRLNQENFCLPWNKKDQREQDQPPIIHIPIYAQEHTDCSSRLDNSDRMGAKETLGRYFLNVSPDKTPEEFAWTSISSTGQDTATFFAVYRTLTVRLQHYVESVRLPNYVESVRLPH